MIASSCHLPEQFYTYTEENEKRNECLHLDMGFGSLLNVYLRSNSSTMCFEKILCTSMCLECNIMEMNISHGDKQKIMGLFSFWTQNISVCKRWHMA